jgi:hypothetical protein
MNIPKRLWKGKKGGADGSSTRQVFRRINTCLSDISTAARKANLRYHIHYPLRLYSYGPIKLTTRLDYSKTFIAVGSLLCRTPPPERTQIYHRERQRRRLPFLRSRFSRHLPPHLSLLLHFHLPRLTYLLPLVIMYHQLLWCPKKSRLYYRTMHQTQLIPRWVQLARSFSQARPLPRLPRRKAPRRRVIKEMAVLTARAKAVRARNPVPSHRTRMERSSHPAQAGLQAQVRRRRRRPRLLLPMDRTRVVLGRLLLPRKRRLNPRKAITPLPKAHQIRALPDLS